MGRDRRDDGVHGGTHVGCGTALLPIEAKADVGEQPVKVDVLDGAQCFVKWINHVVLPEQDVC